MSLREERKRTYFGDENTSTRLPPERLPLSLCLIQHVHGKTAAGSTHVVEAARGLLGQALEIGGRSRLVQPVNNQRIELRVDMRKRLLVYPLACDT